MSNTKSQYVIFGVLLLTALSLSALFFLSSSGDEQAPKLSKENSAKNSKVDGAPLLDGVASKSEQQNTVLRSTPLDHDQLVVSSILEGTSIDGSLKADADGKLVLDIGVRDFFDYFLSIADDVGAEAAIGEIQRYAQSYLPEPARTQALELLGNYLRYKQTEYRIQQTPITQASLDDSDALQLLKTSFELLKLKRQDLFSAEQDLALFSIEDSYANYTLASLALMADESTSDQQKREQLDQLESQLPSELSASLALTKNDRQRQQRIESAVTSTQDDVQVYEQLEQYGVAQQQINSVIGRRQQQRQFDASYQLYQNEKQGLDIGSQSYQNQLSQLQNRLFISPEDLTQAKLRDLKQD